MRIFLILISLGICLLFYLYPDMDIYVSSLFYHNGFYLQNTLFAKLIYKATIVIIALFSLFLIFALFFETVTKKEWIEKRVLIYLLLVLLIAPGFLVNIVFKNHFGRARPSQIQRFGGDKIFTPAMVMTDQCKKNCSFTSGHAAAAFYFLSLVPLFRGRKRMVVASLALLWGGLVGFVRIIQGGHFLSDVVCSAVIVYITSLCCYYLIFERKNV